VASYYLDTSALVKRYAREQGSAWVRMLLDPSARHALYTIRLTGPELVAALARKARTGEMTTANAALVVADVRRRRGLLALTFVSADNGQRQAAAAEGLPVDDPNAQP